jgi:hypothetical protein
VLVCLMASPSRALLAVADPPPLGSFDVLLPLGALLPVDASSSHRGFFCWRANQD